MASDILYEVSTACEELFENVSCTREKNKQEEIILEHIKLFAQKNIQIDDFRSDLEWFNVSKRLSLNKDLKGKIVVLDFFTYCCINCLHILPYLKKLEEEYPVQDGLIVIGVHSAKFDNEKDSANILAAVQRYNITHPVVNDADGIMWKDLSIPCWPTLLIIGPNGEALFLIVGEGLKDDLFTFVKTALNYYKDNGQLLSHSLPISTEVHIKSELRGPLLFPGKIASIAINNKADNNNETSSQDSAFVESINNNRRGSSDTISILEDEGNVERLAVSDTGHHRVIIFTTSGRVEHVIGGNEPGFIDGTFNDSRFHSPQGVIFHNPKLLYVADTENNAIREINLRTLRVRTLVGNDIQTSRQPLSSPWDLCLVSSSLLADEPKEDSDKNVLLIAMAGSHQIWALFLNSVVWWKNKTYSSGTCVSIVGNGKEENRNNAYPHAAGFAQPSGITLAKSLQNLYVADSESSSIRQISLQNGKVSAVVGGDKIPFNLFNFGDKDGKQYEAKLQHPLGVAWCEAKKILYVADSYNHKLKSVDVQNSICTTVLGSGRPGVTVGHYDSVENVQLNEPGGLCVSQDGQRLYIADTNNHCIKVVYLEDQKIDKLPVFLNEEHKQKLRHKTMTGVVIPTELKINSKGGEIALKALVTLGGAVSLTAIAPQKWSLELPDASWSASSCGGDYDPEILVHVIVPEKKQNTYKTFSMNYRLYVCVEHSQCTVKELTVKNTVIYADDAPSKVNLDVRHVFNDCGMSSSTSSYIPTDA